MKHRIIFTAFLFLFSLMASAQREIKVVSMELLTNDIKARTQPRMDANGLACAIVRVVVPALKGMTFSGWVVGDAVYNPGEYEVYVPEGAKKIKFNHENYAPGEIKFTMPIESKCVYKVVLEIPEIDKVYVTDCGSKMSQGSALYSLRKYSEARSAFQSAMNSKDITADLKPSIQAFLDQCNTCIYCDEQAKKALLKISDMKKSGNASQQQLVSAVNDALKYINTLNDNNPSEFYTQRIQKLENIIENQPLEVRFTTVKWLKDVSGFTELGPMAGVEVLLYTGTAEISPDMYKNEKKFEKFLKDNSANITKTAVTGKDGIADIQFDRKKLPTYIIFHPVGYNNRTKISVIEMDSILRQSKGDYMKRQFTVKMYLNDTYTITK